MNAQPISQAQDADLRLSQVAMERAALRARELAIRTGTELIVTRDGVIEHIKPQDLATSHLIQEPNSSYECKP